MNRRELIEAVATEAGIEPGAAAEAIDGLVAVVGRSLAAGEQVVIPGFGTFEARSRAARQGRNPRTGETIEIAASVAPAFKPSAAFKRTVTN